MSANQTPIPLNIECFLHDKDVTGKMQRQQYPSVFRSLVELVGFRAEFEELAAPVFEKIRQMLLRLLEETGVNVGLSHFRIPIDHQGQSFFQKEDVDEIEMVGGSSRIPMIRRIIQDVFNKDPKTTMNLDEAVARGWLTILRNTPSLHHVGQISS